MSNVSENANDDLRAYLLALEPGRACLLALAERDEVALTALTPRQRPQQGRSTSRLLQGVDGRAPRVGLRRPARPARTRSARTPCSTCSRSSCLPTERPTSSSWPST